jgi:hypothetical protein
MVFEYLRGSPYPASSWGFAPNGFSMRNIARSGREELA